MKKAKKKIDPIKGEIVECPNCYWVGCEGDLEFGFYESYESPMPINDRCPNCKTQID